MSDTTKPLPFASKELPHSHAHPEGKRCCGRRMSEKCRPEEEAARINPETGEKSCCKGHGHRPRQE